jgi:hypothetical protein
MSLTCSKVEYPAVTICSPGISEDNLEAGFFKHFFAFLAANKITAGVSPYNASFLLNWAIQLLYPFLSSKVLSVAN